MKTTTATATVSPGSRAERSLRIPDAVKINLARMLQKHEAAGGVARDELERVYRKTFGQMLDVSVYDFRDLSDFLDALDFVRIDSEGGDGAQRVVHYITPPSAQPAVQPVPAATATTDAAVDR
jgi:uncharacterized protein (DUF1697 family)